MPPAILCADAPSPLEIKLTLSEGLGPLTEAESLSHRCDLADLDEGTALCLANFGDLDGHSTGAVSAYGGPPCGQSAGCRRDRLKNHNDDFDFLSHCHRGDSGGKTFPGSSAAALSQRLSDRCHPHRGQYRSETEPIRLSGHLSHGHGEEISPDAVVRGSFRSTRLDSVCGRCRRPRFYLLLDSPREASIPMVVATSRNTSQL